MICPPPRMPGRFGRLALAGHPGNGIRVMRARRVDYEKLAGCGASGTAAQTRIGAATVPQCWIAPGAALHVYAR